MSVLRGARAVPLNMPMRLPLSMPLRLPLNMPQEPVSE